MRPKRCCLCSYQFNKIMQDVAELQITDFRKDEYMPTYGKEEYFNFKWKWHNYIGDGQICVIDGKILPDNEYCKTSYLRISNIDDARKDISEVYNELELAELLQYIFDNYRIN